MQPSSKCIDLIKASEQCRLKAYMPTPNDVPTIGWGSTGPDIKLGMTWTQGQADSRFMSDVTKFSQGVQRYLTVAPTQGQLDGMVCLAYNIGLGAFGKSTLCRKHNLKDFKGAALEFPKWNKQAGKVLKGLVIRREKERVMYASAA